MINEKVRHGARVYIAGRVSEAERVYKAMSEKGQIHMPLEETFWAKKFAMFNDQFGTPWMINVEKEMN